MESPFPCGFVPLFRTVATVEGYNASIVIVPANSVQLAADGAHFQHRIPHVWRNIDSLVSACMPWKSDLGEDFKCFRVLLTQGGCHLKSVNQQRLTADFLTRLGSWRRLVLQHVEGLQPGRIGEVGGVCVCWEGDVCVGRIGPGQVWSEVVEATVVGDSNEGNLLEQFLGGFGRWWRSCNKDEAKFSLNKSATAVDPNSAEETMLTIYLVSLPIPDPASSMT